MSNSKTYETLDEINQDFIKQLMESNPFEQLGAIPVNFNTDKHYTKFNRLHLSFVLKRKCYKTSKFLTFKQICAKGGCVVSGEKSYPIFFTSWVYKFNYKGMKFGVTAFDLNSAVELANKKCKVSHITSKHVFEKYCFTKYFNVFNLEQSEGIEYEEDEFVYADENKLINSIDLNTKSTRGLSRFNEATNTLMISEKTSSDIDGEYYPEIFKAIGDALLKDEDMEFYEKKMITHIMAAFLSQSCGLETPIIKIADTSLIELWLEQLNESYYFLWRCATKAQQLHDKVIEGYKIKEKVA